MKKTLVFFGSAIAMVAASQIPARAGAQPQQTTAAGRRPTQQQTAQPQQGAAAGRPVRRAWAAAQCASNPYNCPDAPNPLPKVDTVWLEEMTWMDVRDAMKAGKTTVIISHRRHGAERSVARARQAQLRAARELRRDRAQAR